MSAEDSEDTAGSPKDWTLASICWSVAVGILGLYVAVYIAGAQNESKDRETCTTSISEVRVKSTQIEGQLAVGSAPASTVSTWSEAQGAIDRLAADCATYLNSQPDHKARFVRLSGLFRVALGEVRAGRQPGWVAGELRDWTGQLAADVATSRAGHPGSGIGYAVSSVWRHAFR